MERDNRHEFFTCTDIRLKDRHQIDKELEIAKDDRKKIFKIGESNEKKLAKLSGEVSELKTALAQKDKQIENLIGEVTKSNSLIVKLASEIQRLAAQFPFATTLTMKVAQILLNHRQVIFLEPPQILCLVLMQLRLKQTQRKLKFQMKLIQGKPSTEKLPRTSR